MKRHDHRPEEVKEGCWLSPSVDIYENQDEFLVQADLPGASKDALRINLDESDLTIEGSREVGVLGHQGGRSDNGCGYWSSGFRRRFQLPEGIDRDKVNAELTHGVLTLHLPKAAAIRPRQIAVQGG